MIEANNPELQTWVDVPKGCDFPIQNLPFGIFRMGDGPTHVGVAIGEQILDLSALFKGGFLDGLNLHPEMLVSNSLNALMGLGKLGTRQLRQRISVLLRSDNEELRDNMTARRGALKPIAEATLLLPVKVGDYTDFYSSEQHAYNVGCMFRDPDNALMPNWKHIPVGYHGRASSIIPSGQSIHRPCGQTRPDDNAPPVYGPCQQMDFELEVAFVSFQGKPMGQRISIDEAEDFIFGLCLFNDWSARDIQKWEYVPLGPFLAKNFASSISPWIITLDALQPFRTSSPVQEPEVLPYLKQEGDNNYNIDLEVLIETQNGDENLVSQSNYKHMYWSMRQQLAHHSVNGCNIQCGDMLASGTISASEQSGYGSMLELAWKGSKPLKMKDNTERRFIEDGDTVIMRGHAEHDGVRIGFGEVRSTVLPPISD